MNGRPPNGQTEPSGHPVGSISALNLLALLAERALALVLIALVAALFGATADTDTYFVALIVPVTIGVAVSEAVYTVLLRLMSSRDHTLGDLLVRGLVVYGPLVAATFVLYVLVLLAISPNDLAVWLAFAPVLATIGLGGLYAAYLTAAQRYALGILRVPLASVLALAFVAAIVPASHSTTSFALAVALGHVAALVVLVALSGRPRGERGAGRASRRALLAPAGSVFAASLVGGQPVSVVERLLASGLSAGSVTWLVAARGFALLPAVLAQALGNGIFPAATQRDRALDRESLKGLALLALRLGSLTTLVAMAAVVFCRRELIQAALVRGDFTAADGDRTAPLAALLALSLVGLSASAIAGKALFAVGRQRTVAWVTGAGVVAYVSSALLLRELAGVKGLAAAYSASTLATGAVLAGFLASELGIDARTALREWLAAPALLAGAFAVGAYAGWALVRSDDAGFARSLATIAVSLAAGGVTFAAGVVAARGRELALARRVLGRSGLGA